MADLNDVKQFAASPSPWAHVATTGSTTGPMSSPCTPAGRGDGLWFMCGASSVKARNVNTHPDVVLHWQVTEAGDGVELWGRAEVHADLDTKRRLWTGIFDYDLNLFAPGGPENSPVTAFVAITPLRAVLVKQYGAGGIERWRAARFVRWAVGSRGSLPARPAGPSVRRSRSLSRWR